MRQLVIRLCMTPFVVVGYILAFILLSGEVGFISCCRQFVAWGKELTNEHEG